VLKEFPAIGLELFVWEKEETEVSLTLGRNLVGSCAPIG